MWNHDNIVYLVIHVFVNLLIHQAKQTLTRQLAVPSSLLPSSSSSWPWDFSRLPQTNSETDSPFAKQEEGSPQSSKGCAQLTRSLCAHSLPSHDWSARRGGRKMQCCLHPSIAYDAPLLSKHHEEGRGYVLMQGKATHLECCMRQAFPSSKIKTDPKKSYRWHYLA